MKEKISSELKISVWKKQNGAKHKVKCPCCNIYDIFSNNFDCGHMTAEACGGKTTLDNLIPICHKCNCSMGTTSYDIFRNILNGKQEVEKIPEMLKVKVWCKYFKFGSRRDCSLCEKNIIEINVFDCGMIINKKNNGKIILDNLYPMCNKCHHEIMHKNIKEVFPKFKKNISCFWCCLC